MRAAFSALKSVLIGGVVFLLPIGVAVIVLGKLLQLARRIGQAIHDAAFPNYAGNLVPLLSRTSSCSWSPSSPAPSPEPAPPSASSAASRARPSRICRSTR